VIEQNLKVQKTGDRVIDLGPKGGDGEIVATGMPEDVAREKRSYTGHPQAGARPRRRQAQATRRGGGVTEFPSPRFASLTGRRWRPVLTASRMRGRTLRAQKQRWRPLTPPRLARDLFRHAGEANANLPE
jgi:hypothetical protein